MNLLYGRKGKKRGLDEGQSDGFTRRMTRMDGGVAGWDEELCERVIRGRNDDNWEGVESGPAHCCVVSIPNLFFKSTDLVRNILDTYICITFMVSLKKCWYIFLHSSLLNPFMLFTGLQILICVYWVIPLC